MSRLDRHVKVPTTSMSLLLLAMVSLLAPAPCYGQMVKATLYGTVTDPTGANTPEVSVTATEKATGTAAKTTSDSTGGYLFPALSPGTYIITLEKSGFKTKVVSGITLLVNQNARVDAQLEVGAVTTRVEVTGATPLVDTRNASLGAVIEAREAVDLPLNLRQFGQLALLVPGTAPRNGGGGPATSLPFSAQQSNYSANGARDTSNNPVVDGVDVKDGDFGGYTLQPPPDSIQEFKIQTNIYSAAFGKYAGSTINVVTKSGTNDYHGTVYEFLRNDKLDARNFFAVNKTDPNTGLQIPGTARPPLRRNQFGFSLGGPVRKNKTFFFGNYEALREIRPSSATATVPTSQQLNGNFSGVLTGQTINLCGAGGPASLNFDRGQLFDPATESLFSCPAGSAKAGNTILVGSPVPGNIITKMDPVAQKVISVFPAPNRSGFPNFITPFSNTRYDHQLDIRIDHTISEKNQLFGRYLFGQSNILQPSALKGFGGEQDYYRAQDMALGWTHTFGPRLLNEAHFAFARSYSDRDCSGCPRGTGFLAGFGITGLQALGPQDERYPNFNLGFFGTVGDGSYRPNINPEMNEKYQDNLTWIRGRHTVVVGADLQSWQVLRMQAPKDVNGSIGFNGQYSSLANVVPGVGQVSGLADFLLGFPSAADRTFRFLDTNQVGGKFLSPYAQDDIKISPNLAVNLGLRWEFREPAVDERDNYVTLVPTGPIFSGPGNALLVTAAPDAVNDALCTNDPSLLSSNGRCLIASSSQRAKLGFTGRRRRSLIGSEKNNWAPRLGITWRPNSSDKLVVRTGFGIFYDMGILNNQHFVDNNPVFSPTQFVTTFTPAPPISNTAGIFVAPGVSTASLANKFISVFVTPDYRSPYSTQWSFGISSQLAQDWALEVDYVGNKGTHNGTLHIFANQPSPGVGPAAPRRPYPDFNVILTTSPDGNSNYNSLQARVTKRFSRGFTFLGSYTWAKGITDTEGDEGFVSGSGNFNPQNDNNRSAERGPFVQDIRQRLVLSYILQLPFGKGKRFLNRGGVSNVVLGDWSFSGISSFQSGFPYTVSSRDFSNTGSTSPRPDRTCNGGGPKTVSEWFNPGCFTNDLLIAAQSAGTPRFGNSGRNLLSGPGLNNWDLALLKDFRLSERFKLQFRGEFYDAFNTPHFGLPNTNITSSTVGQIGSAAEPRDIQLGLKVIF